MTTSKKATIIAEPNSHAITITREFDAPRELVFKMFTEAEHYVQWLGPRSISMTLDRFEPWSGGSWRYLHTDADGNEYGFHGVNHDVTAPERIIGTFEFEGLPENGHVCLETTLFEALPNDRTRIVIQDVFQSVEDRDGMLQSGMDWGMNESYARLDELLESLTETA